MYIVQIENKRERITYGSIVEYVSTSFDQRFLDYLGPVCFNSMNLETRKSVCSKSYNPAKQCVNR